MIKQNEIIAHYETLGAKRHIRTTFHPGEYSGIKLQPDLVKMIAVFAARLEHEEHSELAKQVLDAFTMNLYDDRSVELWQNEFPDSRLAEIFISDETDG